MPQTIWLALSIGNTHYHWAKFRDNHLLQAWDAPYPQDVNVELLWSESDGKGLPELWLASVVPQETERWQAYPHLQHLQLADIPLQNCYPTLGLDRALGAWGGWCQYGGPLLLIDAGTALTLTGVDHEQRFQGGAILPGLGLMTYSLSQRMTTLPQIKLKPDLPTRWGRDTVAGIHSGIVYTVRAGLVDFVTDWLRLYPQSQIIFTGGDGEFLFSHLKHHQAWGGSGQFILDQTVIFHGIAALRQQHQSYQKRPKPDNETRSLANP